MSKGIDGGELTINLFGLGMTALHKAGLAGLWMTLEALENENGGALSFSNGSGSWERTPRSVTLRWTEKPEVFFNTLFERSFKIDKNGLLWFPGLGDPIDHPSHAVILSEAMHGVHFQVPKTRGAAKQRKEISIQMDDDVEVLRFLPFQWIAHQKAAKDFSTNEAKPVVSWLLPGAARRHETHKSTAIEEGRAGMLSLLFLPVGAVYFRVVQKRTRPKDRKKQPVGIPRFALALPEIDNLESYSALRKSTLPYGTGEFFVSGADEAAWRLLTEAFLRDLLSDLQSASCTVISFGASPGTRQNARVGVAIAHPKSKASLRVFAVCRQVFLPIRLKAKTGETYWETPQVPGFVAANLSQERDWWMGFTDFVADRVRFDYIIRYEKGGLAKMVDNKEAFPDGPERTFVLACQEAWRRRMGQISDKAKREHSSFGDQVNREFTRTSIAFSRCKNAASLREVIVDFWARGGGSLKSLQEGWHDVLALMDEKNWRKGRDLALLALASYKPATKEEAAALNENEGEEKKDE